MPAIGYVTKQPNGSYKGQLKTVSIRADIEVVPNRSKSADSQPDYRVLTQGVEVGAGWLRIGESSGKEYVSLSKIKECGDCSLSHWPSVCFWRA